MLPFGMKLTGRLRWAALTSVSDLTLLSVLGSFFYGQYSTNLADGSQLVLYAVAASVIGGTSLFGGRGKTIHGVLGGLVIGGIVYGMALLGLHVEWELIVTGSVLVAAVLIDVLSRRGAGAGGPERA